MISSLQFKSGRFRNCSSESSRLYSIPQSQSKPENNLLLLYCSMAHYLRVAHFPAGMVQKSPHYTFPSASTFPLHRVGPAWPRSLPVLYSACCITSTGWRGHISQKMFQGAHFKRVQCCPTWFKEDQVEERMLRTTVVDTVPSVLFLFVTSTRVDIDPWLAFTRIDGTSVQMKLSGVISHRTSHSTNRIITPADVWFHDTITTSGTSIYEWSTWRPRWCCIFTVGIMWHLWSME
jgi:hypothetical protein